MDQDSDAIFRCLICGLTRVYGNGRPDAKDIRPTIGCATCEKATRHEYKGLADHEPVSGLRTREEGMVAQ